jgi:hypothetical protein
VFDHCLYYGRVKTQDKKVRESIETYIYELGGGLHAGVKGLDPFSLGCGVYGCCPTETLQHASIDVVVHTKT